MASNALQGSRGSVRLNGLFLPVLSPASDPHVGCRLELTRSKEKHLIALHIDHSWSTTHPRFKHDILALICCQKYYTLLKARAPRSVLKLNGPSLHIT